MFIVMVVVFVLIVIPLLCLTLVGFILQLDHAFMDGIIANRIRSRFSGNASNDQLYEYVQWFAEYEAERMDDEQFDDIDAVNEEVDKISSAIGRIGGVKKGTAEHDRLTTAFYARFKETYLKSKASKNKDTKKV